MSEPVSRREMLGHALRGGLRLLADLAGEAQPDEPRRRPDGLAAIAGDFTPELLAMEAERLGLDPDSPDREALLQAVLDAMHARGNPDRGKGNEA